MNINKGQLESILKINGIEVSAPDDEIRSILISANFNNDEVETALMVLRENVTSSESKMEGLHKVFRTDQGLKSSEISALLGIDVDIENTIIVRQKQQQFSTFQFIILWIVSVILAVTCVLFYMYSNRVGVFHPSGTVTWHF